MIRCGLTVTTERYVYDFHVNFWITVASDTKCHGSAATAAIHICDQTQAYCVDYETYVS